MLQQHVANQRVLSARVRQFRRFGGCVIRPPTRHRSGGPSTRVTDLVTPPCSALGKSADADWFDEIAESVGLGYRNRDSEKPFSPAISRSSRALMSKTRVICDTWTKDPSIVKIAPRLIARPNHAGVIRVALPFWLQPIYMISR